jgi:hypothetical protein
LKRKPEAGRFGRFSSNLLKANCEASGLIAFLADQTAQTGKQMNCIYLPV